MTPSFLLDTIGGKSFARFSTIEPRWCKDLSYHHRPKYPTSDTNVMEPPPGGQHVAVFPSRRVHTLRHVFTLSGCCTPFLPVPLGSMYSLWRVFGNTGHWGTLVGMWTDRRGGSPQFIGKDESLTSGKGSYSTHKHSYGTVFHLSSTELDNTVAATATEHDALSNKDPLINKDFNLKFSDYSILHVAITPCRHVHSKQG